MRLNQYARRAVFYGANKAKRFVRPIHRRANRKANRTTAFPYRLRCLASVTGRFQVKCNVPGEGPKSGKEMIRSLDHQMNVQRLCRYLGDRLGLRWAPRKIVYKVPIHDIDMKPVGSGFVRPSNFIP
jgi:hypothetical protein